MLTQVIYTDGACPNNGKVGAKGGYGVWFGHNDHRNISAKLEGTRQTNNRAEMTAVIVAIQMSNVDSNVEIRTDSMYTINTAKWMGGWKHKGWKNASKNTPENLDLVMQLYDLTHQRQHPIVYTYVKGHFGIEGNEEADRLASLGAQL